MGETTQPNEYKEVYYDQYCHKCKHKDEEPLEDTPCDEYLNTPVNLYSHKPVNFEEG